MTNDKVKALAEIINTKTNEWLDSHRGQTLNRSYDKSLAQAIWDASWRPEGETAIECFILVRNAIAIEYKKAFAESKESPFSVDKLDHEHHILWKVKANAFSETLSWLDIKIQSLKSRYLNRKHQELKEVKE